MRIAVAGFEHETNTFAPLKADYEAFAQPKNYPGLITGEAMISGLKGLNLPCSGAIEVLQAAGAEIVPILWCMATPSAHVTANAFNRITAQIVDGLVAAGPLDGVFLELHGAMVAENADDGEGEVLARVRQKLGHNIPIAVPLDLHGNVTPAMVAGADVLDAYRYYPHIDSAATGARTARLLLDMIDKRRLPAKAFRQIDFLIPINGACTDFGPARDIYFEVMPAIEASTPGLLSLSFLPGFPLADFHDVGASVIAYAETQEIADGAADRLADAVRAREAEFRPAFLYARDAVAEALSLARGASKPVVIADTQDNPGGGGPGDTTGMLRELIAHNAKGAVIGAMIDPETAAQAYAAGAGASARFAIGGKRNPGDNPVEVEARVLAANQGSWTGSGPMKAGMTVNLGKVALLETVVEGVLIVVASKPAQTVDRSIFVHLGLVPERLPIIVLKSSVHFRADFTPLASHILVGVAPGPVAIDLEPLAFTKLRAGVRRMPSAGAQSS